MSKPADSVRIDTGSSGKNPGVDAGVTYSQTSSLDGIVVRDSKPTATGLWKQLVDPWDGAGLAGELVTAVRDLLADRTAVEARELLGDVVGEALDGALIDVLFSLTRDQSDRWFWEAVTTPAASETVDQRRSAAVPTTCPESALCRTTVTTGVQAA